MKSKTRDIMRPCSGCSLERALQTEQLLVHLTQLPSISEDPNIDTKWHHPENTVSPLATVPRCEYEANVGQNPFFMTLEKVFPAKK